MAQTGTLKEGESVRIPTTVRVIVVRARGGKAILKLETEGKAEWERREKPRDS